mgnify:CR=1 FL=1
MLLDTETNHHTIKSHYHNHLRNEYLKFKQLQHHVEIFAAFDERRFGPSPFSRLHHEEHGAPRSRRIFALHGCVSFRTIWLLFGELSIAVIDLKSF